jgi:hypothetical protein
MSSELSSILNPFILPLFELDLYLCLFLFCWLCYLPQICVHRSQLSIILTELFPKLLLIGIRGWEFLFILSTTNYILGRKIYL